MIKFSKSGKIGLFGLLFQNFQFLQFQNKAKEAAKLQDLKIQRVLKQENGLRVSRDKNRRKSSKKPKS
jgi:hypothetical protein